MNLLSRDTTSLVENRRSCYFKEKRATGTRSRDRTRARIHQACAVRPSCFDFLLTDSMVTMKIKCDLTSAYGFTTGATCSDLQRSTTSLSSCLHAGKALRVVKKSSVHCTTWSKLLYNVTSL